MFYKRPLKAEHLAVLQEREKQLCRLQLEERRGATLPDAYFEALAHRMMYVKQLENEYSDEAGFPVVFQNLVDEMWEDYVRIDDYVVSVRELRHALDLLKPVDAFIQLVGLLNRELDRRKG